jgi:hypothetical protein
MRRLRFQGSAAAVALVLASTSALSAFQTVKPIIVTPPPRVVVPRPTSTPTAPRVNTGSVGRGVPNGSTPAAGGRASRIAAPRVGLGSSVAGKSGLPVRPGDHVLRVGGTEISRSSGGRVRTIRASGMEVYHSSNGGRVVTVERADGTVAVVNQHGAGYIAKPYDYLGNSPGWSGWQFVERTYSAKAGYPSSQIAIYQRYAYYNAIPLDVYAPRVFYSPGFYAWAYNPWIQPIRYSWGWNDQPWYSYFAAYFSASPTYGSPALWLTDYLISQTLQYAYQTSPWADDDAQQDGLAGAGSGISSVFAGDARPVTVPAAPLSGPRQSTTGGPPEPVTQEVKSSIADEVRRQIALENLESTEPGGPPDPGSSGVDRMLAEHTPRVFVASAPLDLSSGAAECTISEGDVLQLKPETAPGAPAADALVMASRSGDCRKGATVTVGIIDLQEMQNHMRQSIDDGLARLRQAQSRDGLPEGPRLANQTPQPTQWATAAPPSTQNVDGKLSEVNTEASALESSALKNAPKPAASADRAELMSKTPDQIKSLLGKPKTVVDLGAKQIYVFEGRRITFTQGKVSDVQ